MIMIKNLTFNKVILVNKSQNKLHPRMNQVLTELIKPKEKSYFNIHKIEYIKKNQYQVTSVNLKKKKEYYIRGFNVCGNDSNNKGN